jgi:hypothetical protein
LASKSHRRRSIVTTLSKPRWLRGNDSRAAAGTAEGRRYPAGHNLYVLLPSRL